MKSRRRNERGKACDEVQGLEQDGFRAVFPGLLEAVADAPVAMLFESFEREGWASDVAADPEPLSIAAIDGDASVDIDAIEFGIRTIRVGRDETESPSEFARTLRGNAPSVSVP